MSSKIMRSNGTEINWDKVQDREKNQSKWKLEPLKLTNSLFDM